MLNLRDCLAVELIVIRSRHGTFKASPGQSLQSTRTAFNHDHLPTVSNWPPRGFDINKLINIDNINDDGVVAKWKLKYVHSELWLFNQFHKPPIIV